MFTCLIWDSCESIITPSSLDSTSDFNIQPASCILWSLPLKTNCEHFSRARDILRKGQVFLWIDDDCQHLKRLAYIYGSDKFRPSRRYLLKKLIRSGLKRNPFGPPLVTFSLDDVYFHLFFKGHQGSRLVFLVETNIKFFSHHGVLKIWYFTTRFGKIQVKYNYLGCWCFV